VAPLTSTVLAVAPSHPAGVASAVNSDVARTASLLAVAILPAAGLTGVSYLNPIQFNGGFRSAVLLAAGLCAFGGVLAALTIRHPTRRRETEPVTLRHPSHCALDAPPAPGGLHQ
jgi:hypothetical protein